MIEVEHMGEPAVNNGSGIQLLLTDVEADAGEQVAGDGEGRGYIYDLKDNLGRLGFGMRSGPTGI